MSEVIEAMIRADEEHNRPDIRCQQRRRDARGDGDLVQPPRQRSTDRPDGAAGIAPKQPIAVDLFSG